MPTSAEIVPFHTTHMSEAAYDAERARLRETYGDTRQQAGARFEQALAVLFYRSGWTQDELAKKEGKSQKWVDFRLRFGRFLNFSTPVLNPENTPHNLTEGRFRSYWEQTDKGNGNERARFVAVQKLIAEDLRLRAKPRPKIGQAIKDHFADGKWHKLSTITEKIGADEDHVAETMRVVMVHNTYGLKAEKKQVGKHTEYRLFNLDKSISSEEMITKLGPIIEGLKAEGKKNMATMSTATVAYLAGKLQQIVDEWTK